MAPRSRTPIDDEQAPRAPWYSRRVTATFPADGRCDCTAIRYRMHVAPMFVHCCHCRWCQRETGSAFVLNALVETDRLELLAGTPVTKR